MSNTTNFSYLNSNQTYEIIEIIDSYMIVILYIIGMIGAILNIITFRQKEIRCHPCSVYFLFSSIVDFCIMNINILLEIIIIFNPFIFNLIYSTQFWCKIGNYITFILPCLSSSYIIFASIDRYLVSSLNQAVRKWSNLKITRIVIIVTPIIWALLGLYIPITNNLVSDPIINNAQCIVQTNSAVIFSIIGEFIFILFNGAIAPLLLCIFGLLILYDKKKSRQRVLAQQQNRNNFNKISNVANRQNKHMITMLLVQVSLTIIFNIPNIVIYMISYFNMKSYCPMPLLILIIFNTIGRWFHYMNYCKTFYINTLTSSLFRKSLRKQYQHIKHHRIIITITTIFPINRNIG
ncbi:unnamed protein product [Adineta steineri]|uniref:G-protein coupled receptors family 1 profile domain-containing protein n=1 Tax=Adineta steineri TaxID=433720 RepID=A0A814YJM2_9BILA|nr:unnamed protein product [Adineta steineri]